jgi:hypothetical protein
MRFDVTSCRQYKVGFFILQENKMTKAAAARYLVVHPDTIDRLVKEKKLRKLADGGINSEDLEILRLEWEERKKLGTASWLKHGQAF